MVAVAPMRGGTASHSGSKPCETARSPRIDPSGMSCSPRWTYVNAVKSQEWWPRTRRICSRFTPRRHMIEAAVCRSVCSPTVHSIPARRPRCGRPDRAVSDRSAHRASQGTAACRPARLPNAPGVVGHRGARETSRRPFLIRAIQTAVVEPFRDPDPATVEVDVLLGQRLSLGDPESGLNQELDYWSVELGISVSTLITSSSVSARPGLRRAAPSSRPSRSRRLGSIG